MTNDTCTDDTDQIVVTVELVCRQCDLEMPYQKRHLAEDAGEIHQKANDGHVTHIRPIETATDRDQNND